ncbi:MAG: type II toxin-antitoxin system RelE/ParE family toxin [Reyranellaceae bacterium]
MVELLEFQTEDGRSPFGLWFAALDAEAAAKVTVALTRMSLGNFSSVEPVGSGVSEYKINWGPGYRIYFGKDGDRFVILLVGGTKKRQASDIAKAKGHWADYKRRKQS